MSSSFRPAAATPAVAARMSAQRRTDTQPEILVRRSLHALGYRYRVEVPIPGMPRRRIDIVFPKQKVAIFIDGCFWHSCPVHATEPKSNADWWQFKLSGNKRRDLETNAYLEIAGWRVLRFWEHQPVDDVVGAIRAALRNVPK